MEDPFVRGVDDLGVQLSEAVVERLAGLEGLGEVQIVPAVLDAVLEVGALDRRVQLAAFELERPQLVARPGDAESRRRPAREVVLAAGEQVAILASFGQAVAQRLDSRVVLAAKFEGFVESDGLAGFGRGSPPSGFTGR